MHKRRDGLERLIRWLNMHIIIYLGTDTFVLNQCTHTLRQTNLHHSLVGDDQSPPHTKPLEIIAHLVRGPRPELDSGHLHRNDGFFEDIKAPRSAFSLLV